MKTALILIFSFLTPFFASAEPADIVCTYKKDMGATTLQLPSGVIIGGIEFNGNASNLLHNAGADVISWLKREVAQKGIDKGSIYVMERTKESSNVISMLTADVVQGQLQNARSTAWFLSFGEPSKTIGQLTCEVQ